MTADQLTADAVRPRLTMAELDCRAGLTVGAYDCRIVAALCRYWLAANGDDVDSDIDQAIHRLNELGKIRVGSADRDVAEHEFKNYLFRHAMILLPTLARLRAENARLRAELEQRNPRGEKEKTDGR